MTIGHDKLTGTYYRLEYVGRSDNSSPVSRIELTHANATHLLECSHVLGGRRKTFMMRCHILRDLPGDRLRVLVFGRLYWKGTEHHQRCRSVDAWRVSQIPALSAEAQAAVDAFNQPRLTDDGTAEVLAIIDRANQVLKS